ncbi:MAG: hypothetical protein KGZ86_02835 [Candidatus Latescibacteria bacterium]|nr:hypothetical protein [Candidatus Latescibacterota bacterium]
MKTIIITVIVAIGFVLYLFQHRCSFEQTQEITKLTKEVQLLSEEVTRLESQCARMFLFTNLEQTAQKLNLVYANKPAKSNDNQLTNLDTDDPRHIQITHKPSVHNQ